MVMHASFWKLIPLAFAVALATLAYPLVAPQAAYADPVGFDQTSFTFTDPSEGNEFFSTKAGSAKIVSAVSSDPSVAKVSSAVNDLLIIEPVNEGTATITITGDDSSTTTLEIVIPEEYINKRLQNRSWVADHWYGSKKLSVNSEPGTVCVLKVGKEKRTFTLGSKGDKTIKLKKVYKVGTPVSCTFTQGKYHAAFKSKIYNSTYFYEVRAKAKTVKVKCAHLCKGDVVKLTFKGKTYTKKITKSKNYKTLKFKTSSTVPKNAKMKIVMKNKFKQTLFNDAFKLYRGWYQPDIEDEEEDE